MDGNFRKLQEALQQNTEMDSSAELVWDTFEVAEDVQSKVPDASKELERIGDRRLHIPENGEALLAPEDMVKPKQDRSELRYRDLSLSQQLDADKALIDAVKIHFTHQAVKGIPTRSSWPASGSSILDVSW